MLKKNFLANTSVYLCTEHSKEIIDSYLSELRAIFSIIRDCEDGNDINSILDGPICHDGFSRLN